MNPEISIKVERADGWASVVLDRSRRRNAFTGPMLDQLADAVDALSADTSIAAIVLRGEGSAFCSGVDLTELQAQPPQPWVPNFGLSLRRAHIALYQCACPIVVALERFAINGGSALALSGDLIVAGQTAFLQIGEIHQGARMPMNAAWLRVKGHEHLMARLALIGDRCPAPSCCASAWCMRWLLTTRCDAGPRRWQPTFRLARRRAPGGSRPRSAPTRPSTHRPGSPRPRATR